MATTKAAFPLLRNSVFQTKYRSMLFAGRVCTFPGFFPIHPQPMISYLHYAYRHVTQLSAKATTGRLITKKKKEISNYVVNNHIDGLLPYSIKCGQEIPQSASLQSKIRSNNATRDTEGNPGVFIFSKPTLSLVRSCRAAPLLLTLITAKIRCCSAH